MHRSTGIVPVVLLCLHSQVVFVAHQGKPLRLVVCRMSILGMVFLRYQQT